MSFEQFMKDIGLAPKTEAELSEQPTAKVLPFISLKSMRMDDPRAAVAVHVKNLVATYGKEVVIAEAAKLVTDDV